MEAAGSCGICQKALGKEFVNLGEGKKYHIECYLCCACKKKLAGGMFYEVDGKLYCEDDYLSRFAPNCTRCDKSIKDEYIEIDGQNYHSACFSCLDCKKSFNGIITFYLISSDNENYFRITVLQV